MAAVPDTVDGRFDMIAAVLCTVLLRLEREPEGLATTAPLTERFVDDMDGQLRQIGIGDIVVGKHIGKMMSMLGGRLGAYRDGLARGRPRCGAGAQPVSRASRRPQPRWRTSAHALLALRDALHDAPSRD